MSSATIDQEFEALLDFVKQSRGFDFSGYKQPTLSRRLSKRMQAVGAETYGEYTDYLQVHPEEFSNLFNTILINVTGFFRDPGAWDYVGTEIIPRIVKEKPGQSIRIWCAGCASGEEPFTVAMLMAEVLGEKQLYERVKIYATDVDEAALNQARQASYSAKEIEGVPEALLDKYFERVEQRYVFRKDMRRAVVFGRHDLVQDAPISRIDLLVCRNTLIYFNTETQSKILEHFRFALNTTGFLFLGKAEMLLTHTDIVAPVDLRRRIFARMPKVRPPGELPDTKPVDNEAVFLSPQDALRARAFDLALVGQLIVDPKGILVAANGEALRMFGLSDEDLGRSLDDLRVSRRPVELRAQIDEAYAERRPCIVSGFEWSTASGESRVMDIQVVPVLAHSGDPMGVAITFPDMTLHSDLQAELHRSKGELETAYEELQSTNEELETTNEELQSSNEELETTNEELQSSNEELETINEELQSTNEDVRTINAQLRERERELREANTLSESILASLRGGVAVADGELRIKAWNRGAQDLWGLRADEAEGQHLLNLDIGLPLERLTGPLRACLAGESAYEDVTLDATNRRGKAVQCKVSCTPLMDAANDIRGVILLMKEEGRAESSMEQDLAPTSSGSPER
jgi:two-component system, chemotaxis family, CheB/CheR fusion protein